VNSPLFGSVFGEAIPATKLGAAVQTNCKNISLRLSKTFVVGVTCLGVSVNGLFEIAGLTKDDPYENFTYSSVTSSQYLLF
jgi:hypothetical protein